VNGIHQVWFEGGLELVIKHTDFAQDETMFAAVAHGGLSEVPLEQLHSCCAAVTLAEEVGIFGIRPADLRDFFSETDIGIEPDVGYYQRTLEGGCSSQDVKYVFQLLHRLFTCDFVVDAERMALVEKIMTSMLGAAERNPTTLFEVTTRKLVTNDHPFFASWAASDVKKVDPVVALQYFKRMFADPSEFSFVFIGDLDVARIIQLTAHYLASIPPVTPASQRRTRSTVTALDWRFPEYTMHQVLRQPMEDDLSMTTIVFPVSIGGRYEQTGLSRYREHLELIRASQVLERRLLEVLRFELGSVYDVSVGLDFASGPRPQQPEDHIHGTLAVRFTCNPDDAHRLQAAVFDVIDDLIANGPTAEEASKALESERLNRATARRTNEYWLEYCSGAYISARYEGDMPKFLTQTFDLQQQVLDSVTPEIIQETVRVVMGHHRERHVLVCLMPDRKLGIAGMFSMSTVGYLGAAIAAASAAALAILVAKAR
jgi:predicted Zn-dependent peptidase